LATDPAVDLSYQITCKEREISDLNIKLCSLQEDNERLKVFVDELKQKINNYKKEKNKYKKDIDKILKHHPEFVYCLSQVPDKE